MAQKVYVQLVDDLDGAQLEAEAGETVVFALDGKEHEIDLSAEHAAELRGSLTRYIKAGRRRPKGAAPAKRGVKTAKPDLEAIRTWANANGFEVAPRGRVPAAAVDAYNAVKH